MTKSARPLTLSGFDEYVTKKIDAEGRLSGTFAAFVKSEPGGLFISGGKEPSVAFGNSNFQGVLIAGSLRESEEALSVLREAGASIRDIFSEDDFHAKISIDFLSGYLKEILEDMRSPIALAAEFIVVDVLSNRLMRVRYSGDIQIDDLDSSEEDYFFVGLYKKNVENNIKRELEKAKIRDLLAKQHSDKKVEELKRIAMSLRAKFKFGSVNMIV